MDAVLLDGQTLSIEGLERIAEQAAPAVVPPISWDRVRAARAVVDRASENNRQVYGLTTGVGAFKRHGVPQLDRAAFQERMIRTHATAVGPPLPLAHVRAMIAARINGMAAGFSSAGPAVVAGLLALLNRGVHPIVPALGSLGASDLSQNAAMASVLLGFGEAEFEGQHLSGSDALAAAGLVPLALEPGEALALISANTYSLGAGALALQEARRVADAFDHAAVLSLEGFGANLSILDPAAALARPQPSHVAMVRRLTTLLAGSALWNEGAARFLQDPLSFRCVAHVHGALRGTLESLVRTLETDLNSSTDNPLVLQAEDRVFSSAGFDATLLALGFDALRLAWLHVALTADRRVEKLITPAFSGLPGGLGLVEGVDGGIMIASYTCAALAAEVRNLALPASLGIPPVAEGVEDHAGLAPLSVRRTLEMQSMLARVAAIELITAAEAVDRRPLSRLSVGGAAAYALTRAYAPPYGPDWRFAAEALAEHLRTRGVT